MSLQIATADLENENQALKEALTMARANGENSKRAVEKELREATDKVRDIDSELVYCARTDLRDNVGDQNGSRNQAVPVG